LNILNILNISLCAIDTSFANNEKVSYSFFSTLRLNAERCNSLRGWVQNDRAISTKRREDGWRRSCHTRESKNLIIARH